MLGAAFEFFRVLVAQRKGEEILHAPSLVRVANVVERLQHATHLIDEELAGTLDEEDVRRVNTLLAKTD